MVRLSALSLLAVFAGAALADSSADQQVLNDHSSLLPDKWSFDNCGPSDNPIKVQSIEVVPDPPKPGQDMTVVVTATTDDTIEDGAYADVSVKLGLIKLLTKRFDVCEEARTANVSIQCPVHPGDYVVKHTVALPKEIPPAKVNVKVEGFSVGDEALLCLDIVVDFRKFPFPFAW